MRTPDLRNQDVQPEISPNFEHVDFTKSSLMGTWRIVSSRFKQNRVAVIGLVILLIFLFMAVLAMIDEFLFTTIHLGILPYRPYLNLQGSAPNQLPSLAHWLGTDRLGNDIFVRIMYGASLTLRPSIGAGLIGITLGATFGLVAGYFGGIVDSIIGILTEILLAIPGVLLAFIFLLIFGFGGESFLVTDFGLSALDVLMLATGISSSPYYIRMVRSEALIYRELTHVKSAQVLGVSNRQILLKHILPNIMGIIITFGTLGISNAILAISGFSFLGLGPELGTAEWGLMVEEGWEVLFIAPHIMIFPGIAILLSALAFNLVGDGLQAAFDLRTGIGEGN